MTNSIPQKTCSNCKHPFPATSQFFYAHNQCHDGLQPRCKKCFIEGRKNKKPREGYIDGKKRCRNCNELFPPTSDYFRPYRDSSDKLGYYCRECAITLDEKWRRAKGIQPQKPADPMTPIRNYERNKPKIIARANQWKKDNPEKRKETLRNYAVSERGRISHRKNMRIRNIRIKQNVPYTPFTIDEILDLGEAQLWKCHYCHCDIRHEYEIEHVMPISRGGPHAIFNIALSCPQCNRRKHTKTPDEFLF